MQDTLRTRAKKYQSRANWSLVLIVSFILAAVVIFYNASDISNVSTKNRQIAQQAERLELLIAENSTNKNKLENLNNEFLYVRNKLVEARTDYGKLEREMNKLKRTNSSLLTKLNQRNDERK